MWQWHCRNWEKKKCFGNCGNAIAENVKKKKKNCFGNCGNAIAENGKKKNYEICEWVKKKSCHVHNIFTINHTWLIIISSKNLWQINCGNGIAKTIFFLFFYLFIFFFLHFRQWHCHNCQNNFYFYFFTFSAMALPQLPKQFFFFFLHFRQCHCHN